MTRAMFRTLAAAAASVAIVAGLAADTRPIDAEHSKLTVHVYKSGLFSALADNHIIQAPIAGGSIAEEAPLGVTLAVRAGDLLVLDPDLAPAKRADVQMRMLGPEVLDTAKFPEITFASTMVMPAGTDKWTMIGNLTIHGQTRPITVAVSRQNGRYVGSVEIKQRDFGIQPISIAGGTVKVKDQLKIDFEVVPR